MPPKFKPDHVARSFAFGFISLIVSISLVACGPGPEESAAPGSQSFAQGEPSFDLVPVERENGPIRSTQRKGSNDLLDP
jgi:hypothetical protein